MIYVTGDCHSEFDKLSHRQFPAQKELTRKDYVIVCGDFGIFWEREMSSDERYWMKWLGEKPYTVIFVDGNHENFDRLYSCEVVDFLGGRARKLSDNIYQLMRGEVYVIDGKTVFAMGGAATHDFSYILNPALFDSDEEFRETARKLRKRNKKYRVLGESYWIEELPAEEELQNGLRHLERVGFEVDYVITHCAPLSVLRRFKCIRIEDNSLTRYFDMLLGRLSFRHWFFGHYHEDIEIDDRFTMVNRNIIPLS